MSLKSLIRSPKSVPVARLYSLWACLWSRALWNGKGCSHRCCTSRLTSTISPTVSASGWRSRWKSRRS